VVRRDEEGAAHRRGDPATLRSHDARLTSGRRTAATEGSRANDVRTARDLLAALKGSRHRAFVLLTDSLGADTLPGWARTPAQTTDGHLLARANAHGARLATFDGGIPGATLIA
jgi:hypothetical protein